MANLQRDLHDQIERDLKWVASAPSLVRAAGCLEQTSLFNRCGLHLPAAQTSLTREDPQPRVGKYFEQLLAACIETAEGIELLDSNRQVVAGGRTVGEIDFLYRDPNGKTVHLECACKFYLQQCSGAVTQYIGPNPADTLERKTQHLLTHQLPLGDQLSPPPDRHELLFLGRIFYPAFHKCAPPADGPPVYLNPNHLQGIWLKARDCQWIVEQGPFARFIVLNKPFWLSPVQQLEPALVLNAEEMIEIIRGHFAAGNSAVGSGRPLLLSLLRPIAARMDSYDESVRVFVVPDDWPAAE